MLLSEVLLLGLRQCSACINGHDLVAAYATRHELLLPSRSIEIPLTGGALQRDWECLIVRADQKQLAAVAQFPPPVHHLVCLDKSGKRSFVLGRIPGGK